ncbi:MAG TPA: hypothetical protein VG370_10560 [Chloroflexota bacterium]|jgi:hypothetical protein|nr:hypothetical protein [Chloroflexota bacterium]
MPKKRIPGHLKRRPRRRDATPNLPRETRLESAAEPSPTEQPPAYAASVPATSGRPLRPTLRRGIVGPSGRPARPPAVEIDYRYVVQDLRQIAVLAAVGFAILIGLSFVVR